MSKNNDAGLKSGIVIFAEARIEILRRVGLFNAGKK